MTEYLRTIQNWTFCVKLLGFTENHYNRKLTDYFFWSSITDRPIITKVIKLLTICR